MRVVKVRDSTSSGKAINEAFDIEVPVPCSLRDLIRLRVREEVAQQNASRSPTYTGLASPTTESPSSAGITRPEGWSRVDWEHQADFAVKAFERNGYFVFLHDPRHGERQLEDLDEIVDVATDAELRFIRLVPLVGG